MGKLLGSRRAGMRRVLYLMGAWIFLGLAVAGAFLPLLPATPFLLCSVWCSIRAESGLAHWLAHHRRFGPPIRRWQTERTLSRSTKFLATTMIVANWLLLLALGVNQALLAILAAGLGVVLVLIWRIASTPSTTTCDNRDSPYGYPHQLPPEA